MFVYVESFPSLNEQSFVTVYIQYLPLLDSRTLPQGNIRKRVRLQSSPMLESNFASLFTKFCGKSKRNRDNITKDSAGVPKQRACVEKRLKLGFYHDFNS